MSELPEELARRIGILTEESAQGRDFDRASWVWLLLLGLVGPVVLIILGWNW
jgi:hypothetical protein